MSKVPSWYSPIQPKPLYEIASVKAFWDVVVFAENTEVRANRVDVRIFNHETRYVKALEMSCPGLITGPPNMQRSMVICAGISSSSIPGIR